MRPSKMMLVILLLYLVGPSGKFGGATIADMILVLFLFGIMLMGKLDIRWKDPITLLFLFPTLVVAISAAGKLAIGLSISMDEINNLVKMFGLGLLSAVAVSFKYENVSVEMPAYLRSILTIFCVAIIIIALYGVYQYLDPASFRSYFKDIYGFEGRSSFNSLEQAEDIKRVTSIFTHPNALGVFTVCAMVVLIVNRKMIGPLLMVSANVSLFVLLILSNSRISLFLLAIAFMYLLVAENHKKYMYAILAVVVLIVIFVPLEKLLGGVNYDRLLELGDYIKYGIVPKNLDARFSELAYIVPLISGSKYLYFGYPMQVYYEQVFLSWDNQYLGWLIKYGLVSVLMILWALYTVYYPLRLLKTKKLSDTCRRILKTFFLVNILLLIGGVSQDTVMINRWREFYFFFFGFGMTYCLQEFKLLRQDQRSSIPIPGNADYS